MKNEIGNLKIYLGEVKMLVHHGNSEAPIIANYSEKAIRQLELIEQKLSIEEQILICQYSINQLKNVKESLNKYIDEQNDDDLIFINKANQIYDWIDYFLSCFDELEEY